MADIRPVIYLTAGEVESFNQQILLRAGQQPGPVRDRGLLEGAVQRPQNAAYYSGADLVIQAALYMVGIALNHPFIDGNKRTGYISGMTFLQVNGDITANAAFNDPELGVWLEHVVSRQLSFEDFVQRLRTRLESTDRSDT